MLMCVKRKLNFSFLLNGSRTKKSENFNRHYVELKRFFFVFFFIFSFLATTNYRLYAASDSYFVSFVFHFLLLPRFKVLPNVLNPFCKVIKILRKAGASLFTKAPRSGSCLNYTYNASGSKIFRLRHLFCLCVSCFFFFALSFYFAFISCSLIRFYMALMVT